MTSALRRQRIRHCRVAGTRAAVLTWVPRGGAGGSSVHTGPDAGSLRRR